jgi:hypothetical protein
MVGIDIDTGQIHGIGSPPTAKRRVWVPVQQRMCALKLPLSVFRLLMETGFRIQNDGGDVAAIGGATVTSRAVSSAVRTAGGYFSGV